MRSKVRRSASSRGLRHRLRVVRRSAPPSPPGEASTWEKLPRRSGLRGVERRVVAQGDEGVLQRRARCARARGRCRWRRVGTPEPLRAARRGARLRARSSRWNGRCSSTRRCSAPEDARAAAAAPASSCTPWRAQPLRQTRPCACSSSVAQRHARAAARPCRGRARGRAVTMRQRLRQPVASSTSSVTWRPSSSAISAPWMARRPSPAAACANSIEPDRPSWSVSANASYPSSTAAAASSSGSEAPSRKEKAEWAWSSTYTNICSHTQPRSKHQSLQRMRAARAGTRTRPAPRSSKPSRRQSAFEAGLLDGRVRVDEPAVLLRPRALERQRGRGAREAAALERREHGPADLVESRRSRSQ